MSDTIVIGVDPAPRKGLAVSFPNLPQLGDDAGKVVLYTASFKEKQPNRVTKTLYHFIEEMTELAKTHPILLCWDAPLTFGTETSETEPSHKFLCRREIEYILKSAIKSVSLKSNASIQGYAGCQHWTITQQLLGYPSLLDKQPMDGAALSGVSLIFNKKDIQQNGIYLTEVHPALAMSLHNSESNHLINDYKTGRVGIEPMHQDLVEHMLDKGEKMTSVTRLQADDIVDARCARWLGEEWIKEDGNVKLYGNFQMGSFLLPQNDFLDENLPYF